MSILITGGGSKIGTHLGRLLKDAGRDVTFASRSGKIPEGFKSTTLDWYNPKTFPLPFQDGPFEVVYLLPPPVDLDSAKAVIPFIDVAVEKGAKKFLVLTGTQVEKTGNVIGLGAIHGYLHEKGLDYVALRPSHFIDNLITNDLHTIRAGGEIVNNWPSAHVPYVATEDIAKAAYESIVSPKADSKELIIVGPNAVKADEVAGIVSEVLGRPIKYRAISSDETKKRLSAFINPEYAAALTGYFDEIEAGGDDKWLTMSPEEKERLGISVFVGTVTIREWLERHKAAFD